MVTIGYCIRKSDIGFTEHLIKTSGLYDKVQVIEIVNEGDKSLTDCYNEILNKAQYNVVVFTHSDLIIETKQWGVKLIKQFEKNKEFGIIGVAGSKHLPSSGKWWEKPKNLYGRVRHTSNGKTWLSKYSNDLGNKLEEVVVVDGVWFAINKERIKVNFNGDIKGFHFYDIDFSFRNHLAGVKIGVSTLIRVNHSSIGQTNDSWEENRIDFIKSNQTFLPITTKQTFTNVKLKILISEDVLLNLDSKLLNNNIDVSVLSSTPKKYLKTIFTPIDVREPTGYKLGDGKWFIQSPNGETVSKEKTLYKINSFQFDILYLGDVSDVVFKLLSNLYEDAVIIRAIDSFENLVKIVNNNQLK